MRRDTSSSDDRIAKLSQRFKSHAVGRRPQETPRTRERHSLYLDTDLIAQASQAYRDISHELYPHNVSKSEFWEALLGYGLEHLADLKQVLSNASRTTDTSEE
jgi:hypothetical protein